VAAGLSRETISAWVTCLGPAGNHLKSSCADLIRASPSLLEAPEGVDGRAKPGQDEMREPISFLLPPQDFPQTVLRAAAEKQHQRAGSRRDVSGHAPQRPKSALVKLMNEIEH
jgi:hypothetical protein